MSTVEGKIDQEVNDSNLSEFPRVAQISYRLVPYDICCSLEHATGLSIRGYTFLGSGKIYSLSGKKLPFGDVRYFWKKDLDN